MNEQASPTPEDGMTIDDLRKFASDLGLARIEAIVRPGTFMHRLTIAGVDFYFYNHDHPRPDRPEWPTANIKEYDGWGSNRQDILDDASKGHIQGLGRPEATGYETTLPEGGRDGN